MKSVTPFQDCLRQRLGNCVNTVWTPPSQAANMAPPTPQNSMCFYQLWNLPSHGVPVFLLPSLTPFVSELARLYKAFASSSAMESIAIVLPTLLLQKPSSKSKAKEHSACLDRGLSMWLCGNLNDLLLEGRTIQQCIHTQSEDRQKHHACSYANLMFEGKTKAASSE